MQKAFHFLIHVLQKLNYKFKELLICKILQTICQMLSLIIKVLQSLSILQGMSPKDWRYLIKPLTPKLVIRGRSTSKRQDVVAGKQKKTGNATQPLVERHLENIQCPVDRSDPESSSVMHINTKAGT